MICERLIPELVDHDTSSRDLKSSGIEVAALRFAVSPIGLPLALPPEPYRPPPVDLVKDVFPTKLITKAIGDVVQRHSVASPVLSVTALRGRATWT